MLTGTHLLIDLMDCSFDVLNDLKLIEDAMITAANSTGATILHSYSHQYSPYGTSNIIMVQESHLTIHCWPEDGGALVDIMTCGESCDPWKAVESLKKSLKPGNVIVKCILRGVKH